MYYDPHKVISWMHVPEQSLHKYERSHMNVHPSVAFRRTDLNATRCSTLGGKGNKMWRMTLCNTVQQLEKKD